MASKSDKYKIELTAEDKASQTINQVASARDSLNEAPVTISIEAEDAATEVIEGVSDDVETLDAETAEPTLSADDEATEVVEGVQAEVEGLDGASATASLDADDNASGDIEAVSGDLAVLDAESGGPTLEAEDNASEVIDEVLTTAESIEDTFTATIETSGADTATSETEGVATNLGLGAASAAAIVTGLLSVGSTASNQITDVAALATAIGGTLEEASRLKEAWELAGGSIDTLERNVIRANDRLRESPELAAELGIAIDENTSPLEIFVAAVTRLNSGQLTAAERLRLAVEVFGSKGVLVLNDLDTRVGDLGTAMADVGDAEIITQDEVDKAIEFQQQWDDVGDKMAAIQRSALPGINLGLTGLSAILDGSILPAMENFVNYVVPPWLDDLGQLATGGVSQSWESNSKRGRQRRIKLILSMTTWRRTTISGMWCCRGRRTRLKGLTAVSRTSRRRCLIRPVRLRTSRVRSVTGRRRSVTRRQHSTIKRPH